MIILKNLNGDIYTGVDLIYMDAKTPGGNHEAELRVILSCGRNLALCGFEKLEEAQKAMDAIYNAMVPAGVKNPNHIFVDLKELQNKAAAENGKVQA